MAQAPDKTLISDAAWQKAVAREAIIWPIAFEKKVDQPGDWVSLSDRPIPNPLQFLEIRI